MAPNIDSLLESLTLEKKVSFEHSTITSAYIKIIDFTLSWKRLLANCGDPRKGNTNYQSKPYKFNEKGMLLQISNIDI